MLVLYVDFIETKYFVEQAVIYQFSRNSCDFPQFLWFQQINGISIIFPQIQFLQQYDYTIHTLVFVWFSIKKKNASMLVQYVDFIDAK